MDFIKGSLVKSPLNYVGGKYKLLPSILPIFPRYVDTFVDLFAGGCNVGINVCANKIIMNDKETAIMSLMNDWKSSDTKEYLKELKSLINQYNLSKTNEDGFKQIRDDYNNGDRRSIVFFAMLTHAFNYQIRFNREGNFNTPFGRNRSSFNSNIEKNFIKFNDSLSDKHIFTNSDFKDFDFSSLSEDDFVYCDPPYLIACASYNEKGGWSEAEEGNLLDLLDSLSYRRIKFALSNVLEHKGRENKILKQWSSEYNVHYLNKSYSNCNYHTKNKVTDSTVEVLITNY